MKKVFLSFLTLSILFGSLFYSCNKEESIVPSNKVSKTSYEDIMDISQTKTSPKLDKSVYNKKEYFYYLDKLKTVGSYDNFINLLKNDNKLSANEINYIQKLKNSVTNVKTAEEEYNVFDKFLDELKSNSTLNEDEKKRMFVFTALTKKNYKTLNEKNRLKSADECSDCINNNKWYIAAASAAVTAVSIFVSVISFGTLTPLFIAINTAGWAGVYCAICPPCCGLGSNSVQEICDKCPPNYTYDGANCFSNIKLGSSKIFTWNGNVYITPGPNNYCPPGTWFDGANCYVADANDNGYKDAFIHNGYLYVKPKCETVPCQECPDGWKYDGANCFSGISAEEHKFFTWNGNVYVTPDANGNCPEGSWFDGANCYFEKLNNSDFRETFEYNGMLYVKPKCK